MTSRERVRAAFEHREPDLVPIYEQTVCSRVASEIMGRKMRTGGGQLRWQEAAARFEGDQAWREFVEQMNQDVGDLIRELDFDMVRAPWRQTGRPSAKLDEYTFRYEDPKAGLWSVYHYDAESDVFDQVDSAIKQEGEPAIERQVAAEERAVAEAGPPPEDAFADTLAIAERAGGDRFLVVGAGYIEIPMQTAWLEASALRPDLVERLLDCQLARAKTVIPLAARKGFHLLSAGGDLAFRNGPIYSPATFRNLMLPRLQEITRAAHDAGLIYLFRTDGNVWPIAQELLVESGIDAYGEIEVDAGMDMGRLKREHPGLTLWGGVSCMTTLVSGTPAEVREAVRQVIGTCAPGGGFILGSSNSIHAGIPTANFVAMQEAAREFGREAS